MEDLNITKAGQLRVKSRPYGRDAQHQVYMTSYLSQALHKRIDSEAAFLTTVELNFTIPFMNE